MRGVDATVIPIDFLGAMNILQFRLSLRGWHIHHGLSEREGVAITGTRQPSLNIKDLNLDLDRFQTFCPLETSEGIQTVCFVV